MKCVPRSRIVRCVRAGVDDNNPKTQPRRAAEFAEEGRGDGLAGCLPGERDQTPGMSKAEIAAALPTLLHPDRREIMRLRE